MISRCLPAVLAILFGVVLHNVGWTQEPPANVKQKAQPGAKPTKLGTDLIGTWILAEAATPGSPSGVGSRLKFFTGTHWVITQPDPNTSATN
jgi:hypothetical protein